MKNFKLTLFLFFLVFAVSFAIVPLIFVGEIQETFEKQAILETGVSATATVVVDSQKSNIEINGVKYYSVDYQFYDNAGKVHFGTTSQSYAYYEVNELTTLEIKYDPNTFNSVLADYTIEADEEIKTAGIFMLVFGVVDVIFWIVEIVFVVQFIKLGIVSIKGKQYTAKFITIKSGAIYNNVHMYKVVYAWTNEYGEVCEGSSGDDYTLTEAHAFELAGELKILGYRNLSKIISKPSKLIVKQAKAEQVTSENYYVCPYCSSMLQSNATKCPSCGAPRRQI